MYNIYYTYHDIPSFSALTTHGWTRESGNLGIQWDSPDNVSKSKERVEYVLSGCKCKTGCTLNSRLKPYMTFLQSVKYLKIACCAKQTMQMYKQGRNCRRGCKCVNCMNTPSNHLHVVEEDDLVLSDQCNSEDEYVETDCDEEINDEETDKIMNQVFGPESDNEELFV